MDEHWTDQQLDEVIDASARRMTEGTPRPGLIARVGARLERSRAPIAFAWQLASAVALIALAVFAITRLWPQPVPQHAVAPIVRPAQPAAMPTAIASNAQVPSRNTGMRTRRRAPQMIVIERDSQDIPALDAPTPLSVDAAPVAQLRVAPLDVKELSVPPLETEPDGKPR